MPDIDELEKMNPDHPELNQRIRTYWEYFFAGAFKSCLDYIYPPLLEKIPRKNMLTAFKRMFGKKSMQISMDLATIDRISKVVEADEGDFCRIDYTLLMAIQFSNDQKIGKPATEARKKKKREFMLSMYQAQYGKKNAWFDDITMSYCVHVKNKLLAIRNQHAPEWSFMMLTEHPLTTDLIPASVLLILNPES